MNVPITVLPNKEGGYTVVSNVFHFVTEGDTLEEALLQAKEAAECHIEALEQVEGENEEKEYILSLDQSFNTFVSV